MQTALESSQLLLFVSQLIVLLTAARACGYLARRLGQPSVVGELGAGILLSAGVLGAVAPDVRARLFPADPEASSLLLAVATLGVLLLLVVTGAEVDLSLLRHKLRSLVLIPVGSLVLPLALGVALGFVLPRVFVGTGTDPGVFAGFLGVALAMSALPVVARILGDLGLLRRDVGQVTMVAAMADDVVGWILLGLLAGVAADGGFDAGGLAVTVLGVVAFVVLSLTVGQRVVDAALRASLRLTEGHTGALTVSFVVVLVASALTLWIGVEAVLGAFVAGVLLGRSPMQRREVMHSLESLSTAILAPVFFATAGMAIDLRALGDPVVLVWSTILLGVATVGKVGGAMLGARLGRVPTRTGLAVGIGLNARGALGVIAASVALSLGVFSTAAYTAVVLMSLLTSMVVGPMLTRVVAVLPDDADESARLREEELLGESVTINARRVLVPTRGGPHSRVAARVVDLAMAARTQVTVMSLHGAGDAEAQEAAATVRSVAELLGPRSTDRRSRYASDVSEALLRELAAGYDLVAIGASSDVHHPIQLSQTVNDLLTSSPVPVLLVRAGAGLDEGLTFRRILTTATGTRLSRAAEEVAYALGTRAGAEVDVVHVVNRPDRVLHAAWSGGADVHPAAQTLVGGAVALATRFGTTVSGLARVGSVPYEEVLQVAAERGADTIVVGTRTRQLGDRAFLGHGSEYLLEHAPQTMIVVAFPPPVADVSL